MKLLRSFVVLTVLGLCATPLAAQEKFTFVSSTPYGAHNGWGARVGFYSGILGADPGAPVMDVVCVDYLHFVTASMWNVNVSSLSGSLTNTYGYGLFGAAALDQYKKAAWLATQFIPGVNDAQWDEIHGAIWYVMSGGTATQWNNSSIVVGGDAGSAAWLAMVNDPTGDWQNINLAEWSVLSDVNGIQQEYLVRNVVPEPETLFLLGTGLLGLGLLVYYRRTLV